MLTSFPSISSFSLPAKQKAAATQQNPHFVGFGMADSRYDSFQKASPTQQKAADLINALLMHVDPTLTPAIPDFDHRNPPPAIKEAVNLMNYDFERFPSDSRQDAYMSAILDHAYDSNSPTTAILHLVAMLGVSKNSGSLMSSEPALGQQAFTTLTKAIMTQLFDNPDFVTDSEMRTIIPQVATFIGKHRFGIQQRSEVIEAFAKRLQDNSIPEMLYWYDATDDWNQICLQSLQALTKVHPDNATPAFRNHVTAAIQRLPEDLRSQVSIPASWGASPTNSRLRR
jgi:hypothetical protein